MVSHYDISDRIDVGHDAMDTHLHSDGRLGCYLPVGHGTRGKERHTQAALFPTRFLTDALRGQMVKNRWHVPLQVFGTALAILGYILGHKHKGREFRHNNVHSKFASPISLMLAVQIIFGIYLKLHLEKGINGKIRPVIKFGHGILGKALPVFAWTQMLFGGITALGFCQGEHVSQCLAHFIMGSGFIAYAILLTILLVVGQLWLKRTGRSQEFFDSAVITAWGIVNTFTEHRWGTDWVKNDWQHTTMGVIWWCAGLVGIWLSKDRDGRPQRNFIPGFIILITGWAFGGHPQDLMVSAEVHKMFGYTLMGAGLTRIIEVSFVLRDRPGMSANGREAHSFQYVPIFVSTPSLSPMAISNCYDSYYLLPASCLWEPPRSKWNLFRSLAWIMLLIFLSFTHWLPFSSCSLSCLSVSMTAIPARHFRRRT
jgi:hypothetical protein